MPATMWSEIVGRKCDICGKWATHWYGGGPICCDCHVGEEGDVGLVPQHEAVILNEIFDFAFELVWKYFVGLEADSGLGLCNSPIVVLYGNGKEYVARNAEELKQILIDLRDGVEHVSRIDLKDEVSDAK